MKSQLVILFLLIALCWSQTPNRPIIGIVALPSEFDEYPSTQWSYFPASYAKFLESGGAQVVPIQYDLPIANITYLLDRLNGVLFTGGGTPMINPDGSFTPIGATLNFVVNYVVEQNKNGTYYPIWGTCMGFQAIAGLLNKNFSILQPDCVGCDGINKNNFFNEAYQSRLYAQIPEDLHQKMTYANLSSFFHHSMFHYDTFENTSPVNSILTPTTYTYDQVGVKYVSSYESPSMPIYGTQFHQEISTYEWLDPVGVNHGPDAVRLQQYLSKFFVNETKKNPNTFPDQQQYLIENFHPIVDLLESFSQLYFFPAINQTSLEEELTEDNIRMFLQ